MLLDLVYDLYEYIFSNPLETQALILVSFITYYLFIYPFFISSLRNVPGPYLHRICYFTALNDQRKMRWITKVHDLHAKYGNIVILSPNEISVNGNAKFITDIYVKNFPKSKFYENFRNHGFKDNMFASLENDRHIKYKKIVSNIYSKSAIFSKTNSTRNNLVKKVGNLVDAIYKSSVDDWFNLANKTKNLGIDVYSLFASLALDVVSAFELGNENGTDLLSKPEQRHIIVSHREVASMVFWTTLMPRFWSWAAGSRILKASEDVTKWQLSLYANAENNVPKFGKDENLTTLESFKKAGITGEYAYSFLTDNIFAGHETTAIYLTYLCYELSRPINNSVQLKLQQELIQQFSNPVKGAVIDDLEIVDNLPYLNAIMNEIGRIHAPIPGAEPRMVDKPYSIRLDNGEYITVPTGTTISVQPYSMHRLENVFPDPYRFIPERWLQYDDESVEDFNQRIMKQQKYMMPFGKGIRMCLGMNIALIEMKLAVANLYWRFGSKLCQDWCEITEYNNADSTEDKVKPNVIQLGKQFAGNNETDEEKMVMYDSYTIRPYNDECWLEWYENFTQ
ncbi:cytochrome P450 [Scheffersomyces coipomensis]|uniref:cytochrome P450 n=1 Tax=Scheffersomyces coipomensis TaxID=1788519 RepID=UPI00315D2E5B